VSGREQKISPCELIIIRIEDPDRTIYRSGTCPCPLRNYHDDEPCYGEVADLPGVWATGKIQEKSRKNLADIVEGWIVVRQIRGLPIPLIDNPIILI